MKIRSKLTIWFIFIVAVINIISSFSIYFFSAAHREEDLYTRLLNKANNTAKLLIEVDEISAELLRKIETDNPVSLPREKIVIYNYENNILFTTDEEKVLTITPVLLDKIRLEKEIRFKQGEYEVLGFLFADKYDRFVVIIGAVDIFGVRRMTNLKWILISVFGASITLTFLSGWVYAGNALKPISKVIESVNNISISNLNSRLDEGNKKDEIANLALTFNKMLERLEAAVKMQKNFIANASHELRTPLTSITGQLEVALMNKRKNETYEEIISSVLEDIKNLNTISNRLLLLAQTSSEKVNTDFKPLRIDDLIWQVRSEIKRRNKDYQVNVSIEGTIIDESELTIFGNEQLIKTAIINLADNGCKYSQDKEVNASIRTNENTISLQFADKGIGIPPEDLKHIFEPFNRAKNAFSIKGHGIGLSIVDHIVKLHRGTIQVTSRINKGSVFTISFPRA